MLFLPRPEILGHILYVLSRFSGQIPEIPRPRPVVHLHYLGHFGASGNTTTSYISADMKNIISVFYRYRPIRKFHLSAFIGIGRYEKNLIGRTLYHG